MISQDRFASRDEIQDVADLAVIEPVAQFAGCGPDVMEERPHFGHRAVNDRRWWLGASLAMLLVSLSTYGYFVPTMITKIWNVGDQSPEKLARTVQLWTTISPLRTIISFPAWFAVVKALTLLESKQNGTVGA